MGWISIDRKIMSNWLWDDKPFARGQAWIDILLQASAKDSEILFDGNILAQKRGSFITSERKLGDRWGWSRTKIHGFLEQLEKTKMIRIEKANKATVIFVEKYDFFQGDEGRKKPQKSHRKANEKPQKSPINKDNKDNNVREYTHARKNYPNQGMQRDYTPSDLDALERALIKKGYEGE